MEEKTITVNGQEFEYDILSPEVKLIVKHIQDLDTEIGELAYKADTAKVARIGFMNILSDELFKKEAPAE
jgi:hypothetical protein